MAEPELPDELQRWTSKRRASLPLVGFNDPGEFCCLAEPYLRSFHQRCSFLPRDWFWRAQRLRPGPRPKSNMRKNRP